MAWVILHLNGHAASDEKLTELGLTEHHSEWHNHSFQPIVVSDVNSADRNYRDAIVVPSYCWLRRLSEKDGWSTWQLTLGEKTAPLSSSARDYDALCWGLYSRSL